MIRRFQRKFVVITMATLFVILFLIILFTTSLNYYNMNSRADAFLLLLSENKGKITQEDLSSLNEQQKNAVLESIDHNVVLMAAAGSG